MMAGWFHGIVFIKDEANLEEVIYVHGRLLLGEWSGVVSKCRAFANDTDVDVTDQC